MASRFSAGLAAGSPLELTELRLVSLDVDSDRFEGGA